MSTMPIDPTAGIVGPLGPTGPAGIDRSTLAPAAPTDGAGFGELLLDGLDRLEGLTDRADGLAVDAATGRLENVHDYTIAASEASVATQLTVAVRNKAVEAFNEILRMQV
ncbi:flagellar hook-basal body complex protein FliE [Nocardioides sp. TF02-7]|uniref:flagellar hook-basal body complex protein FliE n=1 Tax=Nocardioides sp. TF02-7 TaxID=2917724 RepID=UPI001F06C56B|nr:flagellar hook-basal body complex protein FliE [Nocardioides sp. TF02-7]UMG92959.1 flagellar hook-basal body complex protein FliE [Nocardioides sp. TF02-7]